MCGRRRSELAHFLEVLLCVLIGFSYPLGVEWDAYDPTITLLGTVGLALLYGALGLQLARASFRRLLRLPFRPERLVLAHRRRRAVYGWLMPLFYCLQIHLLNWPTYVRYSLGMIGWVLVDELLLFLPFIVMLVLGWASCHRIDRFLRGGKESVWEAILFQARSSLGLVLAPLLVLCALYDLLAIVPGAFEVLQRHLLLLWLLLLVFLVGAFTIAPLYLRLLWRARPIPPGPLRARLEAFAARVGFRFGNLLIWDTGALRLLNALIVGVVPRMRAVFFTRALLEALSPDELEAVFGHEIGHARNRHLTMNLLFGIGYVFAMGAGLEVVERQFSGAPIAILGAAAAMLLLMWGVLFVAISRRAERQADFYGAWSAESPETFCRALEKVAVLNGLPRKGSSWRHDSVERRLRELMQAKESPEHVKAIRRSIRRMHAVVGLFLIVALGGGGIWAARTQLRAPERERQWQWRSQVIELVVGSEQAAERGDCGKAIRLARAAARLEPYEGFWQLFLADTLFRAGHWTEAERAFRRALDRGLREPYHRFYARACLEELEH